MIPMRDDVELAASLLMPVDWESHPSTLEIAYHPIVGPPWKRSVFEQELSVIILTVKFKSALEYEDALAVMEKRMPDFRALPGLIQKYYGYEASTDAYTGIYLWESEDALLEYRASELAQTIAEAYQAIEQPRIEIFDLLAKLRQEETIAAG